MIKGIYHGHRILDQNAKLFPPLVLQLSLRMMWEWRHGRHRKAGFEWSEIADGEAKAPQKFSLFIVHHWTGRWDYCKKLNKKMGLLHRGKNGSQGFSVHLNKEAGLANACRSRLYFDIQALNFWDWEEKAMVDIFAHSINVPMWTWRRLWYHLSEPDLGKTLRFVWTEALGYWNAHARVKWYTYAQDFPCSLQPPPPKAQGAWCKSKNATSGKWGVLWNAVLWTRWGCGTHGLTAAMEPAWDMQKIRTVENSNMDGERPLRPHQ